MRFYKEGISFDLKSKNNFFITGDEDHVEYYCHVVTWSPSALLRGGLGVEGFITLLRLSSPFPIFLLTFVVNL